MDRDFRPTNDGDMLGKKLLFGVIKLLILLQKANEKKRNVLPVQKQTDTII